MSAADYPMGSRVTFADANAVGALMDDTPRVCVGTVNGKPIEGVRDGDDETPLTFVPVWAERVGRESTTIYVSSRNILSAERPVRP